MKNIKTAVIGAGNMGKNHARVYSEISQLVGIADILPEIGRPLAEKFKTNYYKDYRELIEKEKPEALSVVVPTKFHKDITIDCLRKKIPVLVEKPIASSFNEGLEMLEKAKESKTFLMVGHIERFNPAVIELKKIIKEKRLGMIISLLAVRVGISPPSFPSSDVSIELAIHDIDVFNYLLDEFPHTKKIIKHQIFKKNISDSASLLLEYKNASGLIQTNWITPIKMRKLYVTGTDGFIELDYILQKLTLYDKIMQIKPDGDFFELISLSEGVKKEIFISKKEPLKEEIRDFLRNRNMPDISNVMPALKALEVLS
ncbi:MAG: Gfo/Idh/MocA family oxidoreductase [Candidatus Roizmanbacteria bacterium]|nr:MAG: Gfo/Idh/MocA family oxidoreductase [Candidatus Roizmanbacteria bacterium]